MWYRNEPAAPGMGKPRVGIRDSSLGISGALDMGPYVADFDEPVQPVVVLTDNHLPEASGFPESVRVAVLLEPPAIRTDTYQFVANNIGAFDLVLTFVREFSASHPKIQYCPFGTTRIDPEDRRAWPKNRLVNIIASEKTNTEGQQMRHLAVQAVGHRLDDVMGHGYRSFEPKRDGLADYAYSITVENGRVDAYFTEKIIDCLLCGTIPIYWGPPTIGDFFDLDGIIMFDGIGDLDAIISSLSFEDYESRRDAVERNLRQAEFFADLFLTWWQRGVSAAWDEAVRRRMSGGQTPR